MAGLHLPVQPMEHHYLITDDIPGIAERMAPGGAGRLPAGIDYEANIYFRQRGGLLGTYEPQSTPWKIGGTPPDFGHELLKTLTALLNGWKCPLSAFRRLARPGSRTSLMVPSPLARMATR